MNKEDIIKAISKYKGCQTHKEIVLKNGAVLTGGKDKNQWDKADLLVLLDEGYLNNLYYIFDSEGELTKKIEFENNQRLIIYPIEDRDVPLNNYTFETLLYTIKKYIINEKRVHIQCIGGHGRTGLVLACLLGTLPERIVGNIDDPTKWVRDNYCEKAIESYKQENFIYKITGKSKPEETEDNVISFNKWNIKDWL